MKLRNRFMLIAFGVTVFAILTPILVLFARGFKFDYQNWQLIKTGTIVVKTEPQDVTVFLNNEEQKNKTDSTIRFLIPGDYIVRLEKENYQSWTKRLQVKSQFVTWVNNNRDYIALFRNIPQLTESIAIKGYHLPKDYKQLVFLDGENLNYLDLGSQQTKSLVKVVEDQPLVAFIDKLSWVDAKRSFELLVTKSKLNLDPKLALEAEKIETNGNHVIFLNDGSLYTLTDKLNLLEKLVSSFSLAGDDVWFTQNSQLMRLSLETGTKSLVSDQLPSATQYQIIRANGHLFLLADKTLYILGDKLEKIYEPVSEVYWDQEQKRLLYSNDFEVFMFDPSAFKSELIFRSTTIVSTPISNAATGYIFFQNEGKIKAIELDGRDHRNIYNIADALDKFLVSKDGKRLYVFSQVELRTFEIR